MSENLENEFKLDSDPMSVIRSLPTKKIPIDQIKVSDDVEHDEIFSKKYGNYLRGRLRVHVTRLSLEDITPGFYKPTSEGLEYICDPSDNEGVASTMALIRSGHRPALHLYESIMKGAEKAFVCPDDVPVYEAYKRLGIKSVPSHLLCSNRKSRESSIGVRGIKSFDEPYTYQFDKIFPNKHSTFPSILGLDKPAYQKCFADLLQAIDLVKKSLISFHVGHPTGLHYHQTLYSILVRSEESLRSMLLLFDNKLYINAATLVRTLYELALTFYIDWLAPTEIYHYLQYSSVFTEKEFGKILNNIREKDISSGLSRSDAQRIHDAKTFAFRLTSVVSEKARLFPMGETHHKDVYKFLSKLTHHDFSMTQRYINTLEHGDDTVFHEDVISTTLYCADLFTTAIVTRILDDVGESWRQVNFNSQAVSDGMQVETTPNEAHGSDS